MLYYSTRGLRNRDTLVFTLKPVEMDRNTVSAILNTLVCYFTYCKGHLSMKMLLDSVNKCLLYQENLCAVMFKWSCLFLYMCSVLLSVLFVCTWVGFRLLLFFLCLL